MSEVDDAYPMRVYVESGSYATDSQTTKWYHQPPYAFNPADFPEFISPAAATRIDLLYLNLVGTLLITQGVEGSGVAPSYPANSVSIAEVTIAVGQSIITEADIRDVRPMYVTSSAGFGINPIEETFTATGVAGPDGTVFTLTTFTYSPGSYEINVYSGGVRQLVGVDYAETAVNEITFANPQPLGAEVIVWRVGAASAQYLADLNDVDVDTAQAVTDPDGNRPILADHNNPFATLADVTGAIPFAVEHDSTTGVHGPRVNITQPNANRALSIRKTNVGTGIAVYIENSGSDNALNITQVGADNAIGIAQQGVGNAISVLQSGSGIGLDITQDSDNDGAVITLNTTTSTVAGLRIQRAVTALTREPLLSLEDVTGSTSVNMSVQGTALSFADGVANTARFLFNAGTGEFTITNGGNNNCLTITKTSPGAGRCISVTNQGTGHTVYVENGPASRAVSIRNAYTGGGNPDLFIDHDGLGNPGDVSLLWNGPASIADSLHTHTMVEDFADLDDITVDESEAFRDTAAKRAAAIDEDNPVAALADIYALGSRVAFGTYGGNGGTQTITTSITNPVTGLTETFQPDWVMLYNLSNSAQSGAYVASGVGANNGRYYTAVGAAPMTVVATGFSLNATADARLNAVGSTYVYIAIKSQS